MEEKEKNLDVRICSITGEPYTGCGYNAYPYDGRCCEEANRLYVIPARIQGVTPERIKKKGGNKAFAEYFDKMFPLEK